MTNATLVLKFDSEVKEFPVTWVGKHIVEGEDLGELIYFGTETQVCLCEQYNCEPEMTVVLDADNSVTSQMGFVEETGIIYPVRSL